ncbi:MAG: hypothetical protein QME81_12040, partial [bacterium]|nr:hypothetical protein [bacterium]
QLDLQPYLPESFKLSGRCVICPNDGQGHLPEGLKLSGRWECHPVTTQVHSYGVHGSRLESDEDKRFKDIEAW